MEPDFTSESYMQTAKFQFLERCAYPLRNKAGLSLSTKHILVHPKFLPSVLLVGFNLKGGSRHLCCCRDSFPSECFLLTACLHFRPTWFALTRKVILCHVSLGHKALFVCLQCLYLSAGRCVLGVKPHFLYLSYLLYKGCLWVANPGGAAGIWAGPS